MPGGRINTGDKLQPWKPDPTRVIGPPEPNYSEDADRFKERLENREKKKGQSNSKQGSTKKKKSRHKRLSAIIKDFNFILPYSTYEGKPLHWVLKKDPEFVRNLVKSGHYQVSEMVMRELHRQGVIKST